LKQPEREKEGARSGDLNCPIQKKKSKSNGSQNAPDKKSAKSCVDTQGRALKKGGGNTAAKGDGSRTRKKGTEKKKWNGLVQRQAPGAQGWEKNAALEYRKQQPRRKTKGGVALRERGGGDGLRITCRGKKKFKRAHLDKH